MVMEKQRPVKRVVHHKIAKMATLHLMASGLSNDEIKDIEDLIRKMERKRSHENSSQLLYDLVFSD